MPPLKVFLDEDLPRQAEVLLISLGLDVAYVPTEGIKGLRNGDLLARATREGRILITRDKGFMRRKRYPAGSHAGIVVARLAVQNTPNLLQALRDLFQEVEPAQLARRVVVLAETGHRFVG